MRVLVHGEGRAYYSCWSVGAAFAYAWKRTFDLTADIDEIPHHGLTGGQHRPCGFELCCTCLELPRRLCNMLIMPSSHSSLPGAIGLHKPCWSRVIVAAEHSL